MSERLKIAVVGAGPGGLSAAAHAAELGVSHVLLEQSGAPANTIQRYQKRKHVMAEPGVLPLRSPLTFGPARREEVLAAWTAGLAQHRVNVRYNARVTKISGARPEFIITLADGEQIFAETVVFAIGLQGNPRQLGIPGEQLPCVQYQLDDPDEYRDESIIVVGVGDAGLENALGLHGHNRVTLMNTGTEFDRAKEGNRNAVLQAIDAGAMSCYYSSRAVAVEVASAAERAHAPYVFVIDIPTGQARLPAHRVIARIGAVAPRKFVESCGIVFPNADPASLPALSSQYESNVQGLYVIGALGGYPLIKQAMNQGYEVVEYILGHKIEPADHPLFVEKFRKLPLPQDVDGILAFIQQHVPLYRDLNTLLFRELALGSEVHAPQAGAVIFRKNDYTNSFFVIVQGTVEIELGDHDKYRLTLGAGEFFGEISLLSGRRRSGTVYAGPGCVLLESPRREINKLLSSVEAVKRVLDQQFIARAIRAAFAPQASQEDLKPIADRAQLQRYKTDEALFHEGDSADTLHLVRSGSVAISRMLGGREVVTSYLAAGNYVGEMGLMGGTRRSATVKATVPTETVCLDAASFAELLERNPRLRDAVQATARKRITANVEMQAQPQAGDLISFLLRQGLGEATDVLLIDETLCVGCDNCEKACAATHDGTSRLGREAGPTFAHVHVPTSCRHCENPQCMKDCPPDAIRRAPNGEVFIGDNCIGCGNCERNCPYGVIHMETSGSKDDAKKAVKCDMCSGQAGGPACVRACPTGAAIRVSPEKFVEFVSRAAQPV